METTHGRQCQCPPRAGTPDTARAALAPLLLSQEPLLPHLYPQPVRHIHCPLTSAPEGGWIQGVANADHPNQEIVWVRIPKAGEDLEEEHLN